MVLTTPGPLLTPLPSSSLPKTPHLSYSAQTQSQNEEKTPPPKPYLPLQTRNEDVCENMKQENSASRVEKLHNSLHRRGRSVIQDVRTLELVVSFLMRWREGLECGPPGIWSGTWGPVEQEELLDHYEDGPQSIRRSLALVLQGKGTAIRRRQKLRAHLSPGVRQKL